MMTANPAARKLQLEGEVKGLELAIRDVPDMAPTLELHAVTFSKIRLERRDGQVTLVFSCKLTIDEVGPWFITRFGMDVFCTLKASQLPLGGLQ